MSDVDHLTAVSLEVSSGRAKRRVSKPSIRRMVAAAEKAGKTVTGITTPDGVTLHFGKGESTSCCNPWLDDLKVTNELPEICAGVGRSRWSRALLSGGSSAHGPQRHGANGVTKNEFADPVGAERGWCPQISG